MSAKTNWCPGVTGLTEPHECFDNWAYGGYRCRPCEATRKRERGNTIPRVVRAASPKPKPEPVIVAPVRPDCYPPGFRTLRDRLRERRGQLTDAEVLARTAPPAVT